MNKSYLLFLITMLCPLHIAYAMDNATALLISTSQKEEFLSIVIEKGSFSNAVPYLEQLATCDEEWENIFNNAKATGELITHAYEKYEKNTTYNSKVDMALLFGTPGALNFCAEYIKTNTYEARKLDEQFLEASRRNNLNKIKILLQAGANIDARDNGPMDEACIARMWTYKPALIQAAKSGNLGTVRFLLAHNADPNITTNKKQKTALMLVLKRFYQAKQALQFNDIRSSSTIIEMLISVPSLDLLAMDYNNNTIRDYADKYDLQEVLMIATLNRVLSQIALCITNI